MKTKYIKVAVSERLPEIEKKVIVIGYDKQETSTVSIGENGYWYSHEWESECDEPEFWLEEVPDREEEMKAMLEDLKRDMETAKKDAEQSAESFDKREMEVSYYCSKAMETAYGICLEKLNELLQSLK